MMPYRAKVPLDPSVVTNVPHPLSGLYKDLSQKTLYVYRNKYIT